MPQTFGRKKGKRGPAQPCKKCGYIKCKCLELLFLGSLKEHDLPTPIREYPFARPRQYSADFAYPEQRIIIEVEGVQSHTSFYRFQADCEKYNIAGLLGWRVFRFTGQMLKQGTRGVFPWQVIAQALGEPIPFPPTPIKEQ